MTLFGSKKFIVVTHLHQYICEIHTINISVTLNETLRCLTLQIKKIKEEETGAFQK